MKAKFVAKIFFVFICLCACASTTVAQEKPQPTYVGEYQTSDKDLSAFEAMTEQLILRLLNEPATTRGFIGVFEKGDLGEKVKSILSRHPKLKNQILYLTQMRGRPLVKVGFWIVPQGVESPEPIWCGLCVCPTLSVSGVKSFDSRTEYPTFTAKVEGGSESGVIKYAWKVSAGKIIEGQGTPVIKVDTEGAKEITATVEIGGVCEECPREATFTTKIQ